MSYLGIPDHIEEMARKLCAAAGLDPDGSVRVGYWSYAIGGRAGPGHQAPKQWIEGDGPPLWARFYAQAKGTEPLPSPPGTLAETFNTTWQKRFKL